MLIPKIWVKAQEEIEKATFRLYYIIIFKPNKVGSEPGKIHDQSFNNIGGGVFNVDFSATTKDPVYVCKQNL